MQNAECKINGLLSFRLAKRRLRRLFAGYSPASSYANQRARWCGNLLWFPDGTSNRGIPTSGFALLGMTKNVTVRWTA